MCEAGYEITFISLLSESGLRVRGEGMENGFDKNTLYACMEFSKNNIGERDGGKEEGKQRESRGRKT